MKQKKAPEHHRQTKQPKQVEAKTDNEVADYAVGLNGPKDQVYICVIVNKYRRICEVQKQRKTARI